MLSLPAGVWFFIVRGSSWTVSVAAFGIGVAVVAGDFWFYGSGVANGIQEAGGKIPINPTGISRALRISP
jgi:hypothetical protein